MVKNCLNCKFEKKHFFAGYRMRCGLGLVPYGGWEGVNFDNGFYCRSWQRKVKKEQHPEIATELDEEKNYGK